MNYAQAESVLREHENPARTDLSEIDKKVLSVLHGLVTGGGDVPGLSPGSSMSMTNATECIWGSSGRGAPGAKRIILAAFSLNPSVLQVEGKTRKKVSVTSEGRKFLEENREAVTAWFGPF